VWDAIGKYSLKLLSLAPAEFIHFGTTGELLKLVSEGVNSYKYLGWKSVVKSTIHQIKNGAFNNAYIQHNAVIGENSYIEDSYIMNGTRVGKNCVISTATLDRVTVPDNTAIHCLKQNDGRFVCRIYGTFDSPKDSLESGSFLGVKIKHFLETNGLSPEDLWDSDDRSMWNAKLYLASETIGETVDFALNIADMAAGRGDPERFKSAERLSLCESFNNANVTEILPWADKVADKVMAQRLMKKVDCMSPAAELDGFSLSARGVKFALDDIKKSGFSRKIRGYYYLSKICPERAEEFEDTCFKIIGDSIFDSCKGLIKEKTHLHICENESEVRLPVRVNFGGGWSDTPPYCNEHGGTVLNAAIKLNGELPVVVKMHRIDKHVIALASTDSGAYREFDRVSDIQACRDPYDPFALHKAALIAFGLIPREGGKPLGEILDEIGGGFYLSTEVLDIPRGSGLGTSSILAGAAIKTLYKFFGLDFTDDELYSTVLVMEQLMSTGGGWQDQVGGLTNGIKLITARSGMVQKIKSVQLDISDETLGELQSRFALIYTGQRRLARNLLHEVVGKYIGARPESIKALEEIQKTAALMRYELERGDIDEFAALLSRHWELSKMLDMGCTNTCIDQIFNSVDDLIEGRMICGAGGGGFLQVILKKGVSRTQLRDRLISLFQDSGVDVWDCEFV
jgi:fucokinase